MKADNFILIGGAAALAFFYLRSAKRLTALEVGIADLKLDSKKTQLAGDTVFNAKLSVYNPNSSDVKFQSFTGNIYSNKTRIGNIDTPTQTGVILKARETTKIPIVLGVPNSNTLEQVVSTILLPLLGGQTATLPQKFDIVGTLKAENMPAIPVNESIKLS